MARIRRSVSERAALVDEWRESGLSMPIFCSKRGLNYKTVSGWVYKSAHKIAIENARRETSPAVVAREQQAAPAPKPMFLPIDVADAMTRVPLPDHSSVEIILAPARRIVVRPGFDHDTLRRVVAVLEGGPC
jgi:hypothetical protein